MRASLPVLGLLAAGTLAAQGCGGDSCFPRGTSVATEAGPFAIEALAVGDVVLSYSHRESAVVPRRVVDVHRALATEVRTIEFVAPGALPDAPPESLEVTPSHPFWVVQKRQYVLARDLRAGDELLLRDELAVRHAVIRAIGARELPTPSIEVFNISVEGPESNYFAGGVLVHNKDPGVRICDPAEIAVGPTLQVSTEASGASRHRVEVSTPRTASVTVEGKGYRAGTTKADVPLRELVATGDAEGRRWTIEFVVDAGLGVSLLLQGKSTTSDGSSCEVFRSVAALDAR